MTRVDDEILEWLEENGAGTPSLIADERGRASNYVGGRLRKLVDLGLVERPKHGLYRITEDGTAYLEGDLDASELEDQL